MTHVKNNERATGLLGKTITKTKTEFDAEPKRMWKKTVFIDFRMNMGNFGRANVHEIKYALSCHTALCHTQVYHFRKSFTFSSSLLARCVSGSVAWYCHCVQRFRLAKFIVILFRNTNFDKWLPPEEYRWFDKLHRAHRHFIFIHSFHIFISWTWLGTNV